MELDSKQQAEIRSLSELFGKESDVKYSVMVTDHTDDWPPSKRLVR